jgi:hypothetical protein
LRDPRRDHQVTQIWLALGCPQRALATWRKRITDFRNTLTMGDIFADRNHIINHNTHNSEPFNFRYYWSKPSLRRQTVPTILLGPQRRSSWHGELLPKEKVPKLAQLCSEIVGQLTRDDPDVPR